MGRPKLERPPCTFVSDEGVPCDRFCLSSRGPWCKTHYDQDRSGKGMYLVGKGGPRPVVRPPCAFGRTVAMEYEALLSPS